MTNLADLSATDLLAVYRSLEASPVEAVEACLDRVERIDPLLNAIATVCADQCLEQARKSRQRWLSGTARMLEGVPFGLKDLILTAGIKTSGGSRIFADHVPRTSARLVERLEIEGGLLLAKLHTFEFARGDDTYSGPTRNPWSLERTAGGSSAGAGAALAARLMPVAVGTDTGGSIRVPASFCGVTGLKPTFGRISRRGVMPQSWTLDHVGPLARSVEDVALMLTVLAGYDSKDPSSIDVPSGGYMEALDGGVSGLRVGVPVDWFFEVLDPEVEMAMQEAVSILVSEGASIVDVKLPNAHLSEAIGGVIIYAELASLHEINFHRLSDFGSRWSQQALVDSQFVSAVDYLRALRALNLIQRDFESVFQKVDALIVPGMVGVAPRSDDLLFEVGDRALPWDDVVARMTLVFNLAGIPALSLPAGFSTAKLPLAIQIAARPFEESVCLRIAHRYQQLTEHHLAVPPLVSRGRGDGSRARPPEPSGSS